MKLDFDNTAALRLLLHDAEMRALEAAAIRNEELSLDELRERKRLNILPAAGPRVKEETW